MRIRRNTLIPGLLAATLVAGCAGQQTNSADTDKFSGAEKDVAEAVYDFRDAVAKRDEGKVCDSYFTAKLAEEVARVGKETDRGSTCAKAIEDSLASVDATDIDVEDVTVTGTTATVKIKTNQPRGEDPIDSITLANERGWRISKLPQ